MSIVNQTLRELDARTSAVAPPASLHAVPAVSPRRLGRVAGALLVFVVTAAAVWMVWPRSAMLPEARVPTAPPTRAAEPVGSREAPSAEQPVEHLAEPQQPAAVGATGGELSLALTPALARLPVVTADVTVKPVAAQASETRVKPDSPPGGSHKPPLIQKQPNVPSADEAAEALYRKAVTLLEKGREPQAKRLLEEALDQDPAHLPARQTLVALLSEAGRDAEAETVLRAGRAAVPGHGWFALSLARLEAARGDTASAITTLRGGLDARGVDADYHATFAALLVQAERPAEAAQHYRQALADRPGEGAWWAGLGIALAAQGRSVEAKDAYTRALSAGRLPEKLAVFVRAKLAE